MGRPATEYTATAKTLHWLMAALILCLLGIGTVMIFLPKGGLRGDVYDIHKQVGTVVLALAAIRLGWRMAMGAPALPAAMAPREQLVAHAGHLGLYLLMFAMPIAGIVMSQAGGHPVTLLGMPLPTVVGKDSGLHELAEDAHLVLAWAIGLLVAAHAAAALRHHYALKDDVLRRMLPNRAG